MLSESMPHKIFVDQATVSLIVSTFENEYG